MTEGRFAGSKGSDASLNFTALTGSVYHRRLTLPTYPFIWARDRCFRSVDKVTWNADIPYPEGSVRPVMRSRSPGVWCKALGSKPFAIIATSDSAAPVPMWPANISDYLAWTRQLDGVERVRFKNAREPGKLSTPARWNRDLPSTDITLRPGASNQRETTRRSAPG